MADRVLEYNLQQPIELRYIVGGEVAVACSAVGLESPTSVDGAPTIAATPDHPGVIRLAPPLPPAFHVEFAIEGRPQTPYWLLTVLFQGRRLPRFEVVTGRVRETGTAYDELFLRGSEAHTSSHSVEAIDWTDTSLTDYFAANFRTQQWASIQRRLLHTYLNTTPNNVGADYNVWFGTNRRPELWNGQIVDFTAERDHVVHFGQCRVSVPKSHRIGSVGSSWQKRLLSFTDDRLSVAATRMMKEDLYWAEMSELLAGVSVEDRDAVVFLHGFNVSFRKAAVRAAQIGFDLNISGVMAFYSWPSRGTLTDYGADAASVEASEGFITDYLVAMASKSGAAKVHIIAHSMGNRALLRAVDRIATNAAERSQVPFNQIVIAAADVDSDTFKRLSIAYQKVAMRTTMYVCSKDRAVEASQWIYDSPRVGLAPPVTVVPGVDTVNVSNLDLTLIGHGYVAEARDLLQDIHRLFRDGAPPERRFGLHHASTDEGAAYWIVGR